MAWVANGASFVLATLSAKLLEALTPELSVAMTFSETLPTALFVGVPLNVWVAALKDSQDGNADPFKSVADHANVALPPNVPPGTVNVQAASSTADWLAMGWAT